MPRPRSNRSAAGKSPGKSIEAQRHEQDTRTNIPTAEYQSMVAEDTEAPLRVAYQRRNRDLDPQLVWRGKDEQDLDDLVVNVPPLYIQEKVHPKVLIDDLVRQSRNGREPADYQIDMFADFNGLPEGVDRTEFYQHEGYWQNRMILGDSLQVMASLSEREGLQGKVQCIYYDANNNGTIEKIEVIAAINDYLFGAGDEAISKSDVIKLINLYLFG